MIISPHSGRLGGPVIMRPITSDFNQFNDMSISWTISGISIFRNSHFLCCANVTVMYACLLPLARVRVDHKRRF
jgi:hypothetical protein